MKQLNFKSRIWLGFLILFGLMLFASVYSIFQFNRINENTKTLYNHPILVRKTIKDIEIELYLKAHLVNDISYTNSNKEIDSLAARVVLCDSNLERYFTIVYNRYLGNKSDIDSAYHFCQSWNKTVITIFRCKRENKLDSVHVYLNYFNQTYIDKINSKTKVISEFAEHKTDSLVESSMKIEHNTVMIKIYLLLFIFVVGLLISFIISNSIIKPLQKFMDAVRGIFKIHSNISGNKIESEEDLFELTLHVLKESYQNIEQQTEEIRIINEQLAKANTSLEYKVKERTKELKASVENERSLKEMYSKQGDDLTEMNHEYLSLNEELRANMDEIVLLNEQLLIKNNTLHSLVASRDKFFSILAHDLRNPFNTLLGLSELLIKNYKTYPIDKIELLAKSMNEVSRNTFTLLENLLDWSRLQTGSLVANPAEIKPSEVLKTVIAVCKPSAKAKNISLQSVITSDIIITADSEMLKTVLRNIISNAIKFTYPQGTVTIKTLERDDTFVFEIADNGIGIESENLATLFEVNSRASKNGTANETGTGLGLILCKELVEKNGGKIWVESQLEKGSTFSFSVPIIA